MNKQRIEQIMEKVTKRNLVNVLCGYKTSEVDNEILELLNEVTRLTNNWNELEEWLKSVVEYETLHKGNYMTVRGEWGQEVLDKMKEIKERKWEGIKEKKISQ